MKSSLIHSLYHVFNQEEWNEIEYLLDQYFDTSLYYFYYYIKPSRTSTKNSQKHQLCLSIRTGIDAALDVNRMVYLQTLTDTEELLQQYQQQCIWY